jgi:hypothetical protein
MRPLRQRRRKEEEQNAKLDNKKENKKKREKEREKWKKEDCIVANVHCEVNTKNLTKIKEFHERK